LDKFLPGYQLKQGTLDDDLILVQYHADSALGDGRSAKWWTTTDQANSFTTLDEMMQSLALPPEFVELWGHGTMGSGLA